MNNEKLTTGTIGTSVRPMETSQNTAAFTVLSLSILFTSV